MCVVQVTQNEDEYRAVMLNSKLIKNKAHPFIHCFLNHTQVQVTRCDSDLRDEGCVCTYRIADVPSRCFQVCGWTLSDQFPVVASGMVRRDPQPTGKTTLPPDTRVWKLDIYGHHWWFEDSITVSCLPDGSTLEPDKFAFTWKYTHYEYFSESNSS